MPARTRAMLIGMVGPALQGVGLAWMLLKALVDSGRAELTFRYVIFDPAHLMVFVGIAVSVVCLPVAIQVARAAPEELELELFEREQAQQQDVAADIPGRTWEAAE